MLVEIDHCHWVINDGQQRMVTISLIYALLCRQFANKTQGSQREGLALRMLFDLNINNTWTMDAVDRYTPRIEPPKNDAMHFRQIIRGNTIGSNGTLTTAWVEISNFFSTMSYGKMERYFDFLLQKLEVVCLWIPPHIDPNAVYETINCRGKRLDDLDLIRNFVYSHFNSSGDFERKKTIHEYLEKIRPVLTSSKKASEYMRCHLQCKFGFLRKDYFYRDVREAIRKQIDSSGSDRENATDYVFDLTEQVTSGESLELFLTFTATTPYADFIRAFEVASGTTKSRRNLAVFLRELRGYKVTQPLVFALLNWYLLERVKSKKRLIAKIVNTNLRRLATFVLRTAFVAPKFEPSHLEAQFADYAQLIANSEYVPDEEFAGFLQLCDESMFGVLDDRKFQDAMVEARMTGTGKIKQFLLGINSDMQQDARLLDERYCTVEHILPRSPHHWDSWTGFDLVKGSDWVHRIGNLTLLGPEDNKPGPRFNGDFSKKQQTYKNSSVVLTRELNRYGEWTPDSVAERQRKMIKLATKVWKFD